MRLASRTNPALAGLAVANTGGWQSWTTRADQHECGYRLAYGVPDVQQCQPAHFVNVNWFEFGH